MDQYGRRRNLEIHGLSTSDNENTEKLAWALQKIDENVSSSDIDVAHRTGRHKDDKSKIKKTRPIIVRFTTRNVRNKIYKNKKKVYSFTTKDLGFETANCTFINENLTPATRSLMHETDLKRKEMGWKYIWAKNGKIYCKTHVGTKAVIIQQTDDLNNIY